MYFYIIIIKRTLDNINQCVIIHKNGLHFNAKILCFSHTLSKSSPIFKGEIKILKTEEGRQVKLE